MAKRKAKTKTPRATDAEILKRVNDVYKLLLRGASRSEVLEFVTTNHGVSEGMADIYIKRASAYFNQRVQLERDTELGQALERYEMLFQRALQDEDYKTCIQAQSRIDKIMGLEQHTVRVDDWHSDAIEAIKSGQINYEDMLGAVRSLGEPESLADELFRLANVPIDSSVS
jgi:hypothetical protein